MKNKNLIGFLYMAAIMGLTMIIFISNLIVGNIFSIIVGIFAIIVLCFGLGYMYSKFEADKDSREKDKVELADKQEGEESVEEVEIVPITQQELKEL